MLHEEIVVRAVAFMYPTKLGVGFTIKFQVKDSLNNDYLTNTLQ